jgi:endonuclease/exonuclease/phosphatase family metal-dependent hydrolase
MMRPLIVCCRGACTGSVVAAVWFSAMLAATHSFAQIVLDGLFDDWPEGVYGLVDENYVHLRLVFPDVTGLQTSGLATSVLIDLDNNPQTGSAARPISSGRAVGGAELELMFAPAANRNRDGVAGGAALRVYRADGTFSDLPHQALGFVSMPTYASAEYELRIPRFLLSDEHNGSLLRSAGSIRASVLRAGVDQAIVWHSPQDIVINDVGSGAQAAPVSDRQWPQKAPDSVRIISVNVEWAAPVDEPSRFARVMQAIDADIYLLQEWDKPAFVLPEGSSTIQYSEPFMVDWFSTHIDSSKDWYASRNSELGIIVMSVYPLTSVHQETPDDPALAYRVSRDGSDLLNNTVRYTGAVAQTPLGAIALANIHLRCCGAYGSREDQSRMIEAVAVNTAFRQMMRDSQADLGLIAGDYNLVGSRLPREIIASAADPSGADLAVLAAHNLLQDSTITWRDARSGFSPSRLDYILYSHSTMSLKNAFLVDTEELSDAQLSAAGLFRADSRFSDHLPLVMDIVLPQ